MSRSRADAPRRGDFEGLTRRDGRGWACIDGAAATGEKARRRARAAPAMMFRRADFSRKRLMAVDGKQTVCTCIRVEHMRGTGAQTGVPADDSHHTQHSATHRMQSTA